jgi:hypothetical protein
MIALVRGIATYAFLTSLYMPPKRITQAPTGLIILMFIVSYLVSIARWYGIEPTLAVFLAWPMMTAFVIGMGYRRYLFGVFLISMVVDLAAILSGYPESMWLWKLWEWSALFILVIRRG